MNCPNCGTENRADAKFCSACGSGLAAVCPNGHPVGPTARFCDECGAAVRAVGPSAPAATTQPASERRLVSVLFADLVGFTSLSEGRDAEDVRELLGRYFETARRLVALYGGTIEKFIGDAVMAVWGTPIAQEDDAERAVRAALDLTAAVADLGVECGAPNLRARAGVLTGEAAVTLGAQGQGMVAGDLVNTASRIQSAAEPGSVLVGETTRRASEAAIVYEDAGSHEMKGKTERVPLWRALRVVASRGGAGKSTSFEAPFVGRDRELRMVKELLHSSAEERRAHLVSIIGIAGIGKSRLVWEFEKYIDGLAATYRWHRGRCLAYGEGVTYWALSEMVRMRAGIVEGEDQASAQRKLESAIETYVSLAEEREWIAPRLAHLLGLEERTARDAEDLFSAWRLFFERISEEAPVILVFEDMQWADRSLLDFVDYLLNWSKNHPIFVVAHARPEFIEQNAAWGGARRSSTPLFLEPLLPDAMEELITGLVPGLPASLRTKILDRAQGVPLYAVETVRMLIDRGLLCEEGNAYRPTEPIEDLEVPETLHALIAARLDGLEPAERRLIQDAAVVGKTFTASSLEAITQTPAAEIERLLGSLLHKELLSIQADPRSPERGQYGFLQDLVRKVAYETLSRKDRKAKHLATAAYLETSWGTEEEEVVEVIASHYLEAYQAGPDAPDAPEIKVKALDALANAGRRAESLAAGLEARRYYARAIELADDPLRRAELHERAGHMACLGARLDVAAEHFDAAIGLLEAAGQTHPAARVSAAYARVIRLQGRAQEGIERMEAALEVLSAEAADEDLGTLEAELSRALTFAGEHASAMAHVERALAIAEAHVLPELFSEALNTKSMILVNMGRPEEALVILKHALEVALDNDRADSALRAYNNMGASLNERGRYEAELEVTERMLELARRVGHRTWERQAVAGRINGLTYLGRWDEAIAVFDTLTGSDPDERATTIQLSELTWVPFVHVQRGDTDAARDALAAFDAMKDSDVLQGQAMYHFAEAFVLLGEGRPGDAVAAAKQAVEAARVLGSRDQSFRDSVVVLVESAFAAAELDVVEEILTKIEALPAGVRFASHAPLIQRAHALIAIARNSGVDPEPVFRKAIDGFRELKMPFWTAVTRLELAEWLMSFGREPDAEPLLDEAADAFSALRATPWLERLDRVRARSGRATG